jgi:hypothetical protein
VPKEHALANHPEQRRIALQVDEMKTIRSGGIVFEGTEATGGSEATRELVFQQVVLSF